ncbi:cupin domain-containing protein [Aerosakkonemataceae cyanobacterium BLCC-F154]|uniref:Cupin domain-containing protein n=1 Tax=Floridaenema fluviatile BLCC-F154 TaxID=3153640 RepID=A0ABV4YH76_9CYAN
MSSSHALESDLMFHAQHLNHPDHLHDKPANLTEGEQIDFQIVRKQGDAYYPTEPKFYVGGDIYTVWADAVETNQAFVGLDFYLPPRSLDVGVPQHTHAYEAEGKYVAEGQVNFYFGDGTFTAPEGSFVYYPEGRPMGFQTTEESARLAVILTPGAPYYELAGTPVTVPPPQADIAALQQQVDLGKVAEVNMTYGGSFYIPGTTPTPPGLSDTILVVPDASLINDFIRQVEGVKVFSLDQRPKSTGPFGGEYTSLATLEETNGKMSYSLVNLPPTTALPSPIVSNTNEVFYIEEGELTVQVGDRTEVLTPDTFATILPGQTYSFANLGTTPVKALFSSVVNTYTPKIPQYVPGQVVTSDPKPIGDGWIYTWGAFDPAGNPSSIGVTFTENALDDMFEVTDPNNQFPRLVPHLNMPDMFAPARVYDIEYPQIVKDKTPFDHMGWYANSEGHAPPSIYDDPHVDVHFFLDTIQERERITGAPELNAQLYKYPPDGFLNRDYILANDPTTGRPATGDALQGSHWVDREAPEFNGQPFTETFIFGTYDGEVNFWEPMITKEFFAQKTNLTKPIKFPDIVAEDGFYPTEYSITYNPNFGEYTVSLDNFVYREVTAENFFNEGYYLRRNTDVAAAVSQGIFSSAYQHFLAVGEVEGRNPSWRFDNQFYLRENPDVAAAISREELRSALEHYLLYGRSENRESGGIFHRNYYLQRNPDVAQAIAQGFFANAWTHFELVGQFEGRNPGPEFNSQYYLLKNNDVQVAIAQGFFTSAFQHYVEFGQFENRSGVPAAFGTTSEPILGSNETDDVLYAGAGGNYLIAGNGDDVLVAGAGSDTLEGGAGTDQFVFQAAFEGKGGYGGEDVINDFEIAAGTGDTIKLRNADNGIQINIFDVQGNAVIQIVNSLNIDFTKGGDPATPSGTGNFSPLPIQTITLPGITAAQLMSQGILEINEQRINETTLGVFKSFGTYSYTVGNVAGSSIFGDQNNNIIAGDFVSQEQINTLRAKLEAITEIIIPGAAESTDPSVNLGGTGKIPDSLLPREAFQNLVPTFDSTSVNNELVIGGPGNDLIFGGPGSDTLVGGTGVDVIVAGPGQDFVIGRESVDYIVFDSILDFRDRDNNPEDPISNALPDARIGYIRLEEPYGTILTDPNTTRTGPDIFLVNSQAFNRGIDPTTNPELASQIGYLVPGTMISGDGTGTAATKNGQLKVGEVTVPTSDGPAADDMQPLFYYSETAGRLFFDRDGTGTQFGDFWMADMAQGTVLPPGTPSAVPTILIYVY